MVKLTKIFVERALDDDFEGRETRTLITVFYNSEKQTIKLESVIVESQRIWEQSQGVIGYSSITNKIDVTQAIAAAMPSLEKDIQSMNWQALYDTQNKKEVAA